VYTPEEVKKRELVDIVVALLTLALGFSIAMANVNLAHIENLAHIPLFFPIALFVLLFAFIGHELAHRQVARRLGYFAYFQADYRLLPLAVILPLFVGVVFAAPGAVVISPFRFYGRGDERRDIFFISAAGPLTNIVFAALGLAAYLWAGYGLLLGFAYVNAWLALFNLLPLPPLDGEKIIKTNLPMWLLLIITAGALTWLTLRRLTW